MRYIPQRKVFEVFLTDFNGVVGNYEPTTQAVVAVMKAGKDYLYLNTLVAVKALAHGGMAH